MVIGFVPSTVLKVEPMVQPEAFVERCWAAQWGTSTGGVLWVKGVTYMAVSFKADYRRFTCAAL